MSKFQNLSIRTKVTAAFALVLSVVLALGAVAMNGLSHVNAEAADVRDNWLPSTRDLGTFASGTTRYRQLVGTLTMVSTKEEIDREQKLIDDQFAASSKVWKRYEPNITPGAERELATKVSTAWEEYVKGSQKVIQLAHDGNDKEAVALYVGSGREAYRAFSGDLDKLIDFNVAAGQKAANDGAEAYADTKNLIVGALALAVVLGALAGFLLIRSVSRPVVAMTANMAKLAEHDLTVEISGVGRKDEIGQMAGAVQVFKDNMIRADQLAEQQKKDQEARERRAQTVDSLTKDFDQKVGTVLQTVSSASQQLQQTASGMTSTAEETSKQAGAVAAASEQASTNVQTVASAAEELSSSIAEISRQVGQSSKIAGQAVADAQKANQMVQGLVSASQKIGEVVALITDIAEQTNLLALNATIEAARAGEAGKGFAVVAAEVKNLANQTAKATDEIGGQITGIQSATQDAVKAIETIGKTIGEINEIATAIAAAVEEQGAATQEIARNVEQAAVGTHEVSSNITGVNQAANDTGSAATQVLGAAQGLAKQSNEMKSLVEGFLSQMRAA